MSAVRGRGEEAGMQGTQIAGGRDRARVGKPQRKEKQNSVQNCILRFLDPLGCALRIPSG